MYVKPLTTIKPRVATGLFTPYLSLELKNLAKALEAPCPLTPVVHVTRINAVFYKIRRKDSGEVGDVSSRAGRGCSAYHKTPPRVYTEKSAGSAGSCRQNTPIRGGLPYDAE